MIMMVMSVRDAKAKAFGQPFCATALGSATRSFMDEVKRNSPDNVMFRHPEDFALFALGKFDDETGTFECDEVPRLIMQGNEVAAYDERTKVSKV